MEFSFSLTHAVGSTDCPPNRNTGHTQKNGAVSKVDKQFTSQPTRARHVLGAAETIQVSLALPALRLSRLLWGRGTSFQEDVAVGEGFLRVQVCDYGAA
jgi:hypothetical protein